MDAAFCWRITPSIEKITTMTSVYRKTASGISIRSVISRGYLSWAWGSSTKAKWILPSISSKAGVICMMKAFAGFQSSSSSMSP